MNLTQKTLLAQLKFLVLESAMMVGDDYSRDEVISNLFKVVELLDHIEPKEVVMCKEIR
ncbi:MAG: hypothetical protein K0S80_3582 [Neobacillus sp.]|nr:hypothetical protein [Neobacillus sp.]